MLQVLPPAPPTGSFEDSSSITTDGRGFGTGPSTTAGITRSEYCDQLDIANFFLEMAAKRPFSLQDEGPTPSLADSNMDDIVPKMRGGRVPTGEMASLPPLPQTPPPAPAVQQQQQQQPPAPQAKNEPFSPPPPSDVEVYEKRPLPALPNKRHSGSSTLSRELNAAFATPHRSDASFEAGDDPQPQTQQQQQQQQQEAASSAEESDDLSWEETEIRVVLDRPIADGDSIKPYPVPAAGGISDVRSSSRQSEIHSPQPKLSMQKLFRLTGSGPKVSNTSVPQAYVPPSSSTPSGHNSGHKIKQLMGVDVAPRESSSSEFLRRARWSHQDDDVFASDQDITTISEGCFLDSEDESEAEDVPLALPPTSVPMIAERRNRFENDNVSREQSPIPAPLVINKAHLCDVDDPLVRPNSSAGERRLGLGSSHQYQHQYSSSSSLHYIQEDLYHRTTSQLSRGNNNNTNWRSSGSMSGVSPPTTRESHGSSSFGSGSQLIKPVESEKPISSPPSTASSRNPDTPATWSSSPGLPSGRSPVSPEPSVTSHPQSRPRKRATSTGAFGNIVPQRWQNWQQQHRQSQQQPSSSPQKSKHPKVKIPYDPSTDPHPGIRIILPYELEEEEFPVSSPTKSQHRASLVSNLLKRISGSPTSPYGQSHGHKKRPSEPTTPTWLAAGGASLGLVPGMMTPTSSPITGPPPLTRLDTLALSPITSTRSPTSAAAATIPISGGATNASEPGKQPKIPAPPSGQKVEPPQSNKIITKVSGFSVQAEEQPPRQMAQIVPPTPSQFLFQVQPQNQFVAQHEVPPQSARLAPLAPLAGNQRSSFSISEPPSPILSSLASLGHFNLSSGALGSFNLGNPFSGKDRDERSRERERSGTAGSGSGRSMSSLGFRSPSRATFNTSQSQSQMGGSGSGLRKSMADRSTLFAQKTGELVGLVGQVGKTTKSVLLGKRTGSGSGSKDLEQNKEEALGSPGFGVVEKEREENQGDSKKDKGEKWREDIKSKIRVLGDGGRVLGIGMGEFQAGQEARPTATTSTHLLIPLGSPGLSPPERPERSPIVPGSEVGGFNQFRIAETLPGGAGEKEVITGTSAGAGAGTKDSITGQGREESGPRSPPPVPPRSKARPISGVGGAGNPSALASIGFGSTSGSGSRPGSRPGSSRGIMRDAFATGPPPGSAPGSAYGGSRPGSSRGNVQVVSREGLASRDGREGTEDSENWV